MKRVIISFLIVGVITSLGIIGSNYFNSSEKLSNDKTLISYYVETGYQTGVYEKQDGTTWPEGYVLNEEKSTCDNGSTLSWDSNTNSVVVTASKEDSCKVYFDLESPYFEGVKVDVIKIWEDYDGEITRPESINIVLKGNGELYDEITLSEYNDWRYTWVNLPRGYVWTIEEPNVPDGYVSSIESQQNGNNMRFFITNSVDMPDDMPEEIPPL